MSFKNLQKKTIKKAANKKIKKQKMGSAASCQKYCSQAQQQQMKQIDKFLMDQIYKSSLATNLEKKKNIWTNILDKGYYVEEGSKHGIAYTKDMGYYQGAVKEGKPEGDGVLVFRNLNRYKGKFREGQFEGKGSIFDIKSQSTFKGNFKQGRPQSGILKQQNSTQIKIQEIKQLCSRRFEAKIEFPNGLKYKGELQSNKYPYFVFQGKGQMKFPDGSLYNGQWSNGNMNGLGEYTWANGDRYVGNYMDGMKNGQGKMQCTVKEGQIERKRVYRGYWQKGKLLKSQILQMEFANQNFSNE